MAVLFVIGIVFDVIFILIIDSSNGPVEDYDKRVEIWNTVAGNCSRSKLDDMNINYNRKSLGLQTIKIIGAIVVVVFFDQKKKQKQNNKI